MNDRQEARRLEERALNASGAFQSIIYDGWLLGYRPGPTKRLRCVNPFYPSTVPIPEKIAYCAAFYASVGLPAVFRLLPFSEPPELDGWLEDHGWVRFERTLVAQARLEGLPAPALVVTLSVPWCPNMLKARCATHSPTPLPLNQRTWNCSGARRPAIARRSSI